MARTRDRLTVLVAAFGILFTLAVGAMAAEKDQAMARARSGPMVETDAEAAAALKKAGREASLTVLPTIVAGQAMPPVGEVVALMLERSGMTRLALSSASFTPPADAGLNAVASALAAFVLQQRIENDFMLFTDFGGTPAIGFTSVTGIIVDRQGRIAWCERLVKGDAAFDRAALKEPIDGCVLIAARLRPVLLLADPQSSSAPAGPIAEQMRRAGGVPDANELEGITARAKVFRAKAMSSSLIVVPTRINGSFDPQSAENIASQLRAAGLSKTSASADGPRPTRPSTMNQQRVAWALARELSAWVSEHTPDADYTLMADELIGEKGVLGVQYAICDRTGAIVIVDLQNDHHASFKSLAPRTPGQCDQLIVREVVARSKP